MLKIPSECDWSRRAHVRSGCSEIDFKDEKEERAKAEDKVVQVETR